MQEIVALVSEKTGLPLDTAKIAVEAVVGFLKARLPESTAAQLDGLLAAGGPTGVLGRKSELPKVPAGLFGK
jgi:hypothetical protein